MYTFSKHENSTARPTGDGTTFDCLVKTPSSLMTPFIELQSASNPVAYNYAYIADFNRYYFINDWKFDRGLWYASLAVDVLATYKSEIGSTNLYVLRSSASHNKYAGDKWYPVSTKTLSATGATQTWNITSSTAFNDGYYYITVLSPSGGGSTCYKLAPNDFISFLGALFSNYNDASLWNTLENSVKNAVYNPINYIYSCYWFPFNLNGTSVNSIILGPYTYSVDAVRIGLGAYSTNHNFTLTEHPQASARGYFTNFAPYSKRVFISPLFGRVEYVKQDWQGEASYAVTSYFEVDIRNGQGRFRTGDGCVNINFPFGIQVPITQTSSNIFSKTGNLFKTGVMEAISAAEGNLFGMAFNAVGLAGACASLYSYDMASTGSVGSGMDFPIGITFDNIHYALVDNDNAHDGKPLCEVHTPSSLGGFMIIERGDVEANATLPELARIKSFLESGFYYE